MTHVRNTSVEGGRTLIIRIRRIYAPCRDIRILNARRMHHAIIHALKLPLDYVINIRMLGFDRAAIYAHLSLDARCLKYP
jgi:hypothetical protein